MKAVPKILVVDDEEANHYIAQRILKKMAVEADILSAWHGQEALDMVKAVRQQAQELKLILLDINMPVMDGFEFLEEIQKTADLNTTSLKIVLLSSSTHQLDIARARNYPVMDYIQKPLTPEKLNKFL